MKNLLKRLSPLFALVMAIALCFPLVGCGNSIPSKEESTYELVLAASYKFKNPSSVRVVSGKVYYYEITDDAKERNEYTDLELERGYYISGNLRLSATNGFGATTTGYYSVSYDRDSGTIKVEDIEDEIEQWTDLMGKATNSIDVASYKFLLQGAQKDYEECTLTNDFDIDKVNALLEKKWNP